MPPCPPQDKEEPAGIWQIASGLSRGARKTAHKAGLLYGGAGGECLRASGPRQCDGSKVEKTAVIKYKCVYYYAGPMLYNFTHAHICDLRLLLHMEKKRANLPKLIGRPLKMIKLEGAITENKNKNKKTRSSNTTKKYF